MHMFWVQTPRQGTPAAFTPAVVAGVSQAAAAPCFNAPALPPTICNASLSAHTRPALAGDADARLAMEGLAGSVVVGCDNSPTSVTLSGTPIPRD